MARERLFIFFQELARQLAGADERHDPDGSKAVLFENDLDRATFWPTGGLDPESPSTGFELLEEHLALDQRGVESTLLALLQGMVGLSTAGLLTDVRKADLHGLGAREQRAWLESDPGPSRHEDVNASRAWNVDLPIEDQAR